jgi:hypothetical protein
MNTTDTAQELAYTLNAIAVTEKQECYDARNRYVMEAMEKARALGYVTGVGFDPAEPQWPVIYIELPTGQVSWHIPAYAGEWDGHTTPLKYERTELYIRCVRPDIFRG